MQRKVSGLTQISAGISSLSAITLAMRVYEPSEQRVVAAAVSRDYFLINRSSAFVVENISTLSTMRENYRATAEALMEIRITRAHIFSVGWRERYRYIWRLLSTLMHRIFNKISQSLFNGKFIIWNVVGCLYRAVKKHQNFSSLLCASSTTIECDRKISMIYGWSSWASTKCEEINSINSDVKFINCSW